MIDIQFTYFNGMILSACVSIIERDGSVSSFKNINPSRFHNQQGFTCNSMVDDSAPIITFSEYLINIGIDIEQYLCGETYDIYEEYWDDYYKVCAYNNYKMVDDFLETVATMPFLYHDCTRQ